ncbi:MAG: sensor domain-containing diguanylate cyclase [Ruminiclostridium sp.]|nr:sensor domain-containing diguanylate cyclase [Ruminiclostridium sp.]
MEDSKMLDSIFDITEELYKMMSDDSPDEGHVQVYRLLTDLGRTLADSERATFWKWERASHRLWTAGASGAEKIVIPENVGLVGRALREQKVIVTNDPYSDPDFDPEADKRSGCRTRSVLVMPVANINGDFIGAYQAMNKLGDGGFSDGDVRRLSLAAFICALALESDLFLEESHRDNLTGLKNRMGFYSDLSKLYSPVSSMSLFISDIDYFKQINDTYGHNAGDAMLRNTAEVLTAHCSMGAGVYRWGGEEFIMLLPETDLESCVKKAEECRAAMMETECECEGKTLSATMSFGCAVIDTGLSIEENISRADEKLYIAKESGRNRVVS